MSAYFVVSTVLLFFIGIIWSRSDIPNVLLKIGFLACATWGLVLTLSTFGYIIQLHR